MAKVTLSDLDILWYSLNRICTYKREIKRCNNRIKRHIDSINTELKHINDYVNYIDESYINICNIDILEKE